MDLMLLIDTVKGWMPAVCTVIAGCALIASVTPTKHDDRLIQFILDIINKLGLNVGKATNKDDV